VLKEAFMIRVVSFDVDDTLYDFTAVSRRALEKVAERIREETGAAASALTVDDIIADLETTAVEMEHPYAHIGEFRRRSFTKTLARLGRHSPALADELNRIYVRHRFGEITPYADARPTLTALARSYILCAISNGEQELETLGLADLFKFMVTATEVGFQKPDPRIFQAATWRAGCVAKEMAHVGDSLAGDIAGAKAAGARAIWFNPSGAARMGEVAPDAEVHALSELPGLLETWNG
jgi:FMN hydrolase / 5-amino-6-(5-phospho-D-ribitylamino)uracil phosphatase